LVATATTTLTNGTFDLGGFDFTTGIFTSSNTNTRSIAFGTNNIILSTTTAATVLAITTATNFTYTGTGGFTADLSITRTFTFGTTGGTTSNAPNLSLTSGTAVPTLTTGSWFNLLDFTGSATTGVPTTTLNLNSLILTATGIYTSLTATMVGTGTITSNTASIAALTINGTSATLNDALTVVGTTTLTLGTLNLSTLVLTTSTFASTNSNIRTLAFGTGSISCSGTGTVWNSATATNLTVTGTPVVNVTSVGATAITVSPGQPTEANTISFNFTGGTYALTLFSTGNVKNIDFTGYGGTLAATSGTPIIYGNLTISSGMLLTLSTIALTFGATSGTKTITTALKTLDFPITFNGIGGIWQLQDNMTLGATRLTTFTNGTVDLFGKTLTTNTVAVPTGTQNITFNGGTITLSGTGATAWNTTSASFTTTAGTGVGIISLTAATAKTLIGGGATYNCTLNQGGAGALTISGSSTFNNITNSVQPTTITFSINQINTFLDWNLAGNAGNLVTINSSSVGTKSTVSKAAGAITNSHHLSIRDSTATGGAYWYAGGGSVNVSNNTGWIFGGGMSIPGGITITGGITLG
jgi:hypothetical protein